MKKLALTLAILGTLPTFALDKTRQGCISEILESGDEKKIEIYDIEKRFKYRQKFTLTCSKENGSALRRIVLDFSYVDAGTYSMNYDECVGYFNKLKKDSEKRYDPIVFMTTMIIGIDDPKVIEMRQENNGLVCISYPDVIERR